MSGVILDIAQFGVCKSLEHNIETQTSIDIPIMVMTVLFPSLSSPSLLLRPLLPCTQTHTDVLSGYNATIFAYGQTSSGKTHTMEVLTESGGGK